MTLSFYKTEEFRDGKRIDYLFPLFPHKRLSNLFGSIGERAEQYCAFALPRHGSITFRCDLDDNISKLCRGNYKEFQEMLKGNGVNVESDDIRVKAYYPEEETVRVILPFS